MWGAAPCAQLSRLEDSPRSCEGQEVGKPNFAIAVRITGQCLIIAQHDVASVDGAAVGLDVVDQGDVVGEQALLADTARSATVGGAAR